MRHILRTVSLMLLEEPLGGRPGTVGDKILSEINFDESICGH